MAQGGTLKLSINLNRGVSSTSENSSRIANEQEDERNNFSDDQDDAGAAESRPSSKESGNSQSGSASASASSSRAPSRNNLLNVKVPTATKNSRKRKHIQTNFDDAALLNKVALTAQQKEKERLQRLEKLKQAVDKNDHINQVAALMPTSFRAAVETPPPLPLIHLDDIDSLEYDDDSKKWQNDPDDMRNGYFPSTSGISENGRPPQQHEVIDLSSDDEDEIKEIGSFTPRRIEPPLPGRRRWYASDKDRLVREKMDEQHRIEQERLKKRRNKGDIEKVEITGGKLIINTGHPPEDPDIAVAAHLTHVLQPHQLGGIRFMYENIVESLEEYKNSSGFGCILAHSMGLGKTIQVVTFTEIFFRATQAHKVLVIVPVNTIQNWLNEYDKWMPKYSSTGEPLRTFEVFILGDSVKTFDQRVSLIEEWTTKGGVLLIGYDMFRLLIRSTQPKKPARAKLSFVNGQRITREEKPDDFDQGFTSAGRVRKEANQIIRQALLDPGPDMVACDEGHKIKNLNTDISMALGSIKTTRRIVLTGYPLQNNLMEYFCMVDFVRPKYLGEKKSFSIMFEKPIKNGQCVDSTPGDIKLAMQRTHILVEMLKGFVQRRTHHILKASLPKNKEYVLLLRKSPLQHALYRNFLLYANMEIRSGNSGNVFNPLKAFAACSKIWNHPDVLANTLYRRRAEKDKSDLKKANNAMARAASNPTLSQSTNTPQTLSAALNDSSNQNSVNHTQLWSGLFGQANGDLDIADVDDECGGGATGAKKKGRGRGAGQKNNLLGALADELDMDQGLKYDWADVVMAHHQMGNIDHGYKIKLALDIIDETTAIGEKILLFSQNLTALDLIERYLETRKVMLHNQDRTEHWLKNRNYFRLDGSTNGADREKLIHRFNNDRKVHLFLISTRAGSLGINLVSANRCIILDACWNPCHDAQAVCRVYRYGQKRRTYIYRLIMDNSMEKAIFNRQISKHGLQQRVVDDARVEANVTQKELETLLMYDESLDVVDGEWDTSSWELDDLLLERVLAKNSKLLSQEPFLHESLILEKEEGLSEAEKLEAQMLFERERNLEVAGPGFDPFDRQPNPLAGVTRDGRMSNVNWMQMPQLNPEGLLDAPPPLRATPMPHQLQMIQSGAAGLRSVMGGASGIGTANGIGSSSTVATSRPFLTPNGLSFANQQPGVATPVHNSAPYPMANMGMMPEAGGVTMAGSGLNMANQSPVGGAQMPMTQGSPFTVGSSPLGSGPIGNGPMGSGGRSAGRVPRSRYFNRSPTQPFVGAGQPTGYNQHYDARQQQGIDYSQFNSLNQLGGDMAGGDTSVRDYLTQQMNPQQLTQQALDQQREQNRVHTFSDGQKSVVGLAYPGARFAAECKSNISGTMQKVITDRDLKLSNLAMPSQEQPVPAGSEVTVVRTGAGVYIRLLNGLILDATNSVYDIGATFPVPTLTPAQRHAQKKQQQQISQAAATVKREAVKPEVIDLD